MSYEQMVRSGLDHHRAGRRDHAEEFYRQALALEPAGHTAMFMLGALLIEKQQTAEAIDFLGKAIQLAPAIAEYHNALATALANDRRFGPAATEFARAVELRPDYGDAYLGLGRALLRLGQAAEAANVLSKGVSIKPNHPAMLAELANALRGAGQSDGALAAAKRAVEIDSQFAWGRNILGLIHQDRGETEPALAELTEAIRLQPNLPEAYLNMADVQRSGGHLMKSMQALQQAARLSPGDPRPLHNLGVVLAETGAAAEAIASFTAALALLPDFAEAQSALLLTMNYDPSFSPRQRFEAHAAWGTRQPTAVVKNVSRRLRIRVGYVSADFCVHPVAFFIEPILAAHSSQKFEIFCYSDVARPDAMTNRLRAAAGTWRETAGVGHDALAEMIRQDGIDILVDLAGHTRRNRLAMFARKPAAVQVNYLGYPNTTGLPAIDYRLTDAQADPIGEADQLHTEKLIRLPNGFLCYLPPPVNVDESPPREGITFGSFNNMAKVTEEAIELWAGILKSVAASRLLLKNAALADPQIAAKAAAAFGRRGIDGARIDLRGPTAAIADHLRTYGQVDIALDTFPYNGTTTTCEALWMGVPVACFVGDSHAGRVGASILNQVGLPQLLGANKDEYARIAVELATDASRLRELRAGLRVKMAASPLMNAAQITADIEAAYLAMVHG